MAGEFFLAQRERSVIGLRHTEMYPGAEERSQDTPHYKRIVYGIYVMYWRTWVKFLHHQYWAPFQGLLSICGTH